MKTKAILGISLGAVFAMSMILSPAFAGGVSPGTIFDVVLKDHAPGANPANNPAHYELIATSSGNWTQFALDETVLTGDLAPGATAAVGFGMINDTGYFHGFTSHDFDDCIANPEDCSGYEPHGHGAQLTDPGDCSGAVAQIIPESIVDLGKAKVKVADDGSYSVIELDDIPVDTPLNLDKAVCDVDDISDVEPVAQFHIEVGPAGELCVVGDAFLSADGEDGPSNKNKNGGLTC